MRRNSASASSTPRRIVTQSVVNNAVTYRLNGGLDAATGVITGAPTSVTAYATPLTLDAVLKANIGLFAQDQWTIRRLTLNLGVRFDYFNAYVPAQHLAQGPNVPTRSVDFAQIDDVANWKTVSPRLGASYDLFGTGKTAVKVSLGRYPAAPAPDDTHAAWWIPPMPSSTPRRGPGTTAGDWGSKRLRAAAR